MQARDLFLSEELSPEEVRDILKDYGFQDPLQADRRLQHIAEKARRRERLAEMASRLLAEIAKSADPDAALLGLESFFEAVPSAGGLLSFMEQNPAALELLPRVLGASPFLTQLLLRNPEYFYWLMEGNRYQRVESSLYFLEQARALTRPFEDPALALEALRRYRRRESLRIATQDLLGSSGLVGTVAQVSDLADSVLQCTFEILSAQHLPQSSGFAVFGMGKLGGRELNYSSDIDLIYVYAEESQRQPMLKFAREFTRALTEFTPQGRLYRVDLRLRPMGRTGEIAYSFKAFRQYYETWADTFDRLALIKCRFAAGDPQLGEDFHQMAQEFVYKRYLDHAAVEEIRWLKKRSDRELEVRGDGQRNIKLGLGGIREIEFFIQAFQLLYGGEDPSIRNFDSLSTLDRLVDAGYIPPGDYEILKRAYIFLRHLEHKLQLVQDQQTHLLPEDPAELKRCARRMGYPLNEFQQILNDFSVNVRRIFDSLFETRQSRSWLQEMALNAQLPRQEGIEILSSQGIGPAEDVFEGIRLLQEAPAFPQSPSRMRNLLANLLPRLIESLPYTRKPRLLFSRFDRFCESLGSRASLYQELIENPELSRRLFQILSTGDFLSETLVRNPELLDSLWRFPALDLDPSEMGRLDPEHPGNAMRRFKQREEFKTALLDLFASPDLPTRARVTRIAEVCLQDAVERIRERLPELGRHSFTLAALGKMGGSELTYHSDLDLILVYDDRESDLAQLFNTFVRELREEVEAYTEHGKAYSLDFRLRPQGKHSSPGTPLSVLRSHFEVEAEAWERLAYVKLRPIAEHGSSLPLGSLAWSAPFSEQDRRQLLHIRNRKEREIGREDETDRFDFKVGRGGLMDIQFVVQYLQVQHQIPETKTASALTRLVEAGRLNADAAEALKSGLDFLFRLETIQRLLSEKSSSTLSAQADQNEVTARFLGFESGESLLHTYRFQTERVRRVYQQILGADQPGES